MSATTFIILASVYVLGAVGIVAIWRWSLLEGELPMWGMCAVVALLWPLLLVGGLLG